MEWEAPAIVLDARPFGEGDAVATVMTEAHGAHRGLARGALGRRQVATWQPGNVIQARWVGRLADQLGSISAELVHPGAAMAMDSVLALAVLRSACAVAEGALPEREAHPRVFAGLLRLIANLGGGPGILAALIRWEADLLTDLGYGLDLTTCALSGTRTGLAWVSPRTGRAVCDAAAAEWRSRLLPLPGLLVQNEEGTEAAWRDGLRLTGHFLARDVFGARHLPLPAARLDLADRVAAMAAATEGGRDE